MEKILKIKLTPLEPYFFGNDRTFHYGEEDKKRIGRSEYFIKSEQMPLQTALFGVLRYLGIRDKGKGFSLSEEDKAAIGEQSFAYDNEAQTFGMIRRISPMYLDCGNELFIPLPRDQKPTAQASDGGSYCPFCDYRFVKTSQGERYLPKDYDAKEGIQSGFVSTDGRKTIGAYDLFETVEKTGIQIKGKKYYKMGYIRIKAEMVKQSDVAFVFFAYLEDGFPEITDQTVYLGARKSLFSVSVTEEAEPKISLLTGKDGTGGLDTERVKKLYFLSDAYVTEEDLLTLRESTLHMNIGTRTARGYATRYGATDQKSRFQKTDQLYRLIKAGSVLLYPADKEEKIVQTITNQHMEIIGCNRFLRGGMTDESTSL